MENINTVEGVFIMLKTKVCTKCNLELPATKEYFHAKKNGLYGLASQCKKCRKEYFDSRKGIKQEYDKQYREENKAHLRKIKKIYTENNKEKKKEYDKNRYELNKEYFSERSKRYYKQNAEIIKANSQKWYEENKEYANKQSLEWHRRNREKSHFIKSRNRYKRKQQAKDLPCSFTKKDWLTTKKYFNYECAYCGVKSKLTQDHFIPVSKGGEYTINNIVPVCKSCNSSKLNKDFQEWYPEQEFYNIKREKKIYEYLNYINNDIQQLSIL